MKKNILFVLFFAVTFFAGAQLTLPPSTITSNVPEASQYKVVYEYNIPNNLTSLSYVQNLSATTGVNFTRVAYYLQLDTKWVWVSMNKYNSNLTLAQLGIPFGSSTIFFQQAVSGMNVVSSSNSGLTNGTNLNGNVEIWPHCYGTQLGLAGINGNANTYDFNDTYSANSNCYGCLQIHNYVAQQTIFAYNSFNESNGGRNEDLGIGNNTGTSSVNGQSNPDWTFMYNAGNYGTKKLYILVNACSEITINTHPSTSTQNFCLNGTGSTLSVSAIANSGTITGYQWYRNTTASYSGATLISGATSNSYSIPTSTAGTFYYYCVVTNSNGCGQYSNFSGDINIYNNPTVNTQPSTAGQTLCQNSTATSLSTVATPGSGSISSYQWYKSTTNSNASGSVISGATTSSYTPITNVEGSNYYYCLITNSLGCTNKTNVSGLIKVDSFVWMGSLNNSPANTSNWSQCGIPPSGTNVFFHPNATNDMVLDGHKSYGFVDFKGSNKKLILNNYDIRTSAFYNYGANNYIQTNGLGRVIVPLSNNQTITLPVGKSTYNPLSITNKSGAADSFYVTVNDTVFFNGTSGGGTLSANRVNRTWNISKKMANAGSGIDLTFNWNANDVIGNLNFPTLNHHNGSGWEIPVIGSSTFTTNSLTFNGYKGTFSPFTIGGSNVIALPVELKSFSTLCENDYVDIDWKTASEKDNDRFELFKSVDAYNWEKIHTIKGQGNKSTETNYRFFDYDKQASYYRLKNIDFNNKEMWSEIIYASCNQKETPVIIYPNPAKDFIVVSVPWLGNKIVRFISLNGAIIKEEQFDTLKSNISIKGLMSGVYTIEIYNYSGKSEKRKLVIK